MYGESVSLTGTQDDPDGSVEAFAAWAGVGGIIAGVVIVGLLILLLVTRRVY